MPNRTPGAPIVEEIVEEHVTPTPVPPPPPVVPKGARRVVEVYEDEEEDDEEDGILGADGYRTVIVKHPRRSASPPPRPTPKRWFGGRF